jgi:anti-sigma B factor antagonist
MPQANVVMNVRHLDPTASVIDIQGDVSAFTEPVLMQAYAQASTPTTHAIILNFTELAYMNSSSIGLLVTLVIRANHQKQQVLAYGLSEHYRRIFALTRIDDVISIYPTETPALAAVRR